MGNACLLRRRHKDSFESPRRQKSAAAVLDMEEANLHQQAIALFLQQELRTQTRLFQRSASAQAKPFSPSKEGRLPRSSSARPRTMKDGTLQPEELLQSSKENVPSRNLDTCKFVLIHGGGFGAWCWYKTMALLEDAGFVAIALDLSASGIDPTDPNTVMSIEKYTKPLSDYLGKLSDNEKVNLVGHSLGGVCMSYAMESHPNKIAKAIFVAATMMKNGQRAFDILSSDVTTTNAQAFVYANGSTHPPTSMELDKKQMKGLFFNRTSAKDVALAMVTFRPIPFAPFLEKLVLTAEKYGSVRRFFIQTMEDEALTMSMQEEMLEWNPPERVLKLKGSDHCPFFSKPQSLHLLFMQIAQL